MGLEVSEGRLAKGDVEGEGEEVVEPATEEKSDVKEVTIRPPPPALPEAPPDALPVM